MYHRCPKLAVTSMSLLWGGFMIYLLTHVQDFAHYGGKFKAGAKYAHQYVSNISLSDLMKETPHTTPASQNVNRNLINVVIQARNDNLGGLISAVNSIYVNTNTKHLLHFYFIVPHDTVSHLEQWMKVPELSNVLYSIAQLSANMEKYSHAAKFAFVDLFPTLHGQAIYLDPDVIVQGDLNEMLDTPILFEDLGAFSDDCHAGSVTKIVASRGETRYASRLNLKQPTISLLDLNPLTCTFSTGVFVTSDVDIWRKENIPGKIKDLIRSHEQSSIIGIQGGSDAVEAAMLVALYRRISPLDPLWHVRNLGVTRGSRYSPFFISNAKLLHWNGHFKPWKSVRSYGSTFEQKLWDKYFIPDPVGLFVPIRKKKYEI